MGAITFAIRLSFIVGLGRLTLPPLLNRALRYVPPAVLTAIIVPEIVRPGGVFDLSAGNGRIAAGIVAAVIAWRTKNALLTVGAGMVILWIWRSLAAS